jgi:hypothetical protein
MFQEKKRSQAVATTLATVAGLGALTMPSSRSDGAAVRDISQIQDNYNLSTDAKYKWAAAVQRTDPTNGTTYASAVAIAPDVFITAGHVTPRDDSTTASLNEIVFGSNYNTSTDRYTVSGTQRYPGYVFGDASTIDLGVGWTSNFIAGFDTPTTFTSIPMGGVGAMTDYGNIGDPNTGEMPSQGYRMTGFAPKVARDTSSYPEARYNFYEFAPFDGIQHNVQGLNFSSGAEWTDLNGNLTDLLIAKTNGTLGGVSITLDLMNPEVQTYLQPIIQDSWDRYNASVPEPSSVALAAVAAGVGLLARRRNRG